MKFYILPVAEVLQPSSCPIVNPAHNDDYNMEQDFLVYLRQHPNLLTDTPAKADFHYLPVFWWRWLWNHRMGQEGREEFKNAVEQAILDDAKTFTVTHLYKENLIPDIGKTIVFLTSRTGDEGIDIPLICKPYKLSDQPPELKYLVSFAGRYDTHPIRREIVTRFENFPNSYFYEGHLGTDSYADPRGIDLYYQKILESAIVLCPRGKGGSSYRFYETMQMGRVPLLIGDHDTRPFQKYLCWKRCSFYAASAQEALTIVQSCPKKELSAMGRESAKMWRKHLTYGKWCKYVFKELADLV